MPIVNGKLVSEKPFTQRIVDFFWAIIRLIDIFFSSFFSTAPLTDHTEGYAARSRPGYVPPRRPTLGTIGRTAMGSCGSGG